MTKRIRTITRFMFSNAISLTTLLAVAYYAGILVEKISEQARTTVEIKQEVDKIQTDVAKVTVDVALVKGKLLAIETDHGEIRKRR